MDAIEPSTAEQGEWSDNTRDYVQALLDALDAANARADAADATARQKDKLHGAAVNTLKAVSAELDSAEAQAKTLREALAWYAEQARLARLIHSEGDAGRSALAHDGGKRAIAALTPPKEPS